LKIVTLNPPYLQNYSRQSRSPCVAKSGTIYYAYYLAYAAAALEKEGYDVYHMDAVIENWTHAQTIEAIKSKNPDLIILDTSTPSIINDVEVARKIKNVLPDSHINLVGTFPTNMAKETFEIASGCIDSVCHSEYEIILTNLAHSIDTGQDYSSVNGISYIDNNGEILKNIPGKKPDGEYLDNLPFVSDIYLRHLGEKGIKRHFYASITWPYIQMLTSRGCPYSCSFCNIPSIASYQTRSIESVVEEFKFIKKHLPFVNEIFIEDDTFPINKKRTIELCNALAEADTGIVWSCNARVETNKEVMKAMKEAGCRLMCVGFESPTKAALDGVVKKTNKDKSLSFMEDARESEMLINGCFIMGLPNDTEDSMQATINFAKDLMPNTAQFYPHMLYPGTASFKWADDNGYVSTKDWSKWLTPDGLHNTVLQLPDLTPEELLHWSNKGRLEFYLNPRYLVKMFFQAIRSPKEGIRMLISGKTFFKHLFNYIISKIGFNEKDDSQYLIPEPNKN
jgi:radical SAM superfamily enzyme YgiQ (UPF0313 family)